MTLVSRLCIATAVSLLAIAPAAAHTYKIGNLVIETPWLRATPLAAEVAGGYLTITNTGSEADRLTGGTLAGAGRFELHEMSITDHVMRMRPVAGGIAIPPGATVELKPGGLHLMALELKGGYAAGESVKGTLTFEKAGTVEVEYLVGGIGSSAPPAHTH
jgi:hypothetical protein